MGMEKVKILIIDDEETICDACSKMLSKEGYILETCCDGTSGLMKFDKFLPDIVFVDLKMPGMSGLDVLRRISTKDRNVVMIVITAYASIESAVESMKKGAFDFLPKPFSPAELKIITKRALARRRNLLETKRLKEEKERMQQNFYFMVSHELRTPLVAVMQYIEVLSHGMVGVVSAEQNRIIQRMKFRLNELLLLIDRWLKLSMLEKTSMQEEFHDFEMISLINDIVDLLNPTAQEKSVCIQVKSTFDRVTACGNKEMIKEVFINLISNAIKYNRENGTVAIQFGEVKDFWVIDVIDTGVGISEEEIPHIMDEFYRVKTEGRCAGAGLGLAIVKKILEIHNGRLEIRSEVKQGSTFSVYLPRALTKLRRDT